MYTESKTYLSVLLRGQRRAPLSMHFELCLGDDSTTVPVNVHLESRAQAYFWLLVNYFGGHFINFDNCRLDHNFAVCL